MLEQVRRHWIVIHCIFKSLSLTATCLDEAFWQLANTCHARHRSKKMSAILCLCLAVAYCSNCKVSEMALCMDLLQCWKWACTQFSPQSELLQLARLSDRGTADKGLLWEVQRGERLRYYLHSLHFWAVAHDYSSFHLLVGIPSG